MVAPPLVCSARTLADPHVRVSVRPVPDPPAVATGLAGVDPLVIAGATSIDRVVTAPVLELTAVTAYWPP